MVKVIGVILIVIVFAFLAVLAIEGFRKQGAQSLLGASYKFVPRRGGPEITSVYPDSPAEKTGIQKGDLIVAINGGDITSTGKLTQALLQYQKGYTIKITVFRVTESKEYEFSVTLGK